MPYPVIDAHQHFWKYDPVRDNWITGEMKMLQRNFLPEELEQILLQNAVSGSVVVQSDQSEKENDFQLALAEKYTFIKGVVGWIDLQAENIEERLSHYRQFSKLKGFRDVLQGDLQRNRMLNPAFQKGISVLNKYGFSYDLLILPDQLPYAEKLVAAYPDQRFVIDHLAKPPIRQGLMDGWKNAIARFAGYPNVFCKISGMVSEAEQNNWLPLQFRPYMDSIIEIFGSKRIMFGSDWPVCLMGGTYKEVKQIVDEYFSAFSLPEQADFFGANAAYFYRIGNSST